MIRAGTRDEANLKSGDWFIADIGFAQSAKSSSYFTSHDGRGPSKEYEIVDSTFASLRETLIAEAHNPERVSVPLNILLEAPLSICYDNSGNPLGRDVEQQVGRHRYWYEGAGAVVTLASLHLIRALFESKPRRQLRLFEGMVSFKAGASSGKSDVMALYQALASPKGLVRDPLPRSGHSARAPKNIAGLAGYERLGIPPVIIGKGR